MECLRETALKETEKGGAMVDTKNETWEQWYEHEAEKLRERNTVKKYYTVLEVIVIFAIGIALGAAF
jgi:hypothetical protein